MRGRCSTFCIAQNTKWNDLQSNDRIQYTNCSDLYLYPLLFAAVMLCFRFLMEKFIFMRLGLTLGIKSIKIKKPASIPLLENSYCRYFKWTHKDIAGLAKQLNWSSRRVERWLRLRKFHEIQTALTKFCKHSWRCFYYTNMFVYELFTLWDKSWFWNIDYCWINYPHQGVTDDVWWYYMISLSFYWSLIFSQLFDVRRRDFRKMFVHYVITITFLSFSWMCNLHRVATLILIAHDAADFLFNLGKCAKYSKFDTAYVIIYTLFVLIWIITKLLVFPFWIIYSSIIYAPRIAKLTFPTYYLFNGMLCLLMIIYIYRSYLIFQLVYRWWNNGKVHGDVRSSRSENSDANTGHYKKR